MEGHGWKDIFIFTLNSKLFTFVLLPRVKNKLVKRLNSLQVLINMNFQITEPAPVGLEIMAAACEQFSQKNPDLVNFLSNFPSERSAHL